MNFPADMLPTYRASISSPDRLASPTAARPACMPKSRKDWSHSSPNLVSPMPMIATSLILHPPSS